MGVRLRHGLKLRNKRETGGGPLKGKNQRERPELSQTCSSSEGHSKRVGSHRAQREISGSGRSRTRRRYFQAQKKTCGHEEVQRRWTGKCIHSQGSTMERSNNFRRHAASERTTRKEGAGGCRAQRGASDRGSNSIRKDIGEGARVNLRPGSRAVEANMEPEHGTGKNTGES